MAKKGMRLINDFIFGITPAALGVDAFDLAHTAAMPLLNATNATGPLQDELVKGAGLLITMLITVGAKWIERQLFSEEAKEARHEKRAAKRRARPIKRLDEQVNGKNPIEHEG